MALHSKLSKYIPYLYFITIIIYWFTIINRSQGITAYPILFFAIPFVWQIIKPNKKINLYLGITFVCLSSYLILGYLLEVLDLMSLSKNSKYFFINGGLFVFTNFVMSLWMVRNSLKRSF